MVYSPFEGQELVIRSIYKNRSVIWQPPSGVFLFGPSINRVFT